MFVNDFGPHRVASLLSNTCGILDVGEHQCHCPADICNIGNSSSAGQSERLDDLFETSRQLIAKCLLFGYSYRRMQLHGFPYSVLYDEGGGVAKTRRLA